MGFGLGLGRGFRDGFGLGMAQILSLESSHQYAESARPILDHLRRAALERQLIAVKSQMPSLDRIYLARQIGCGNSIGGGGDMRKLLRFSVITFLILAAGYYFAIENSAYEVTYECSGVMTKKPGGPNSVNPITAFIKIQMWRWWSPGRLNWMHLPTDGLLLFEIPNGKHEVVRVTYDGVYLNLHPWLKATMEESNAVHGQFSPVSKSLRLELSEQEAFSGSCKLKEACQWLGVPSVCGL